MNTNLIDVVIPTFQNNSDLHLAIQSALNQGRMTNKVFVVDDGSDIEIQTSLETRYRNHKKVNYFHVPHVGHPGVMRKIGIENSQATWIAFLDSDDVWFPGKLELQLDAVVKSKGCGVTSNAKVMQDGIMGESFIKSLPMQIGFSELIRDNKVINSMIMVKRESLLNVGVYADSFRVRTPEDYATWLRILTREEFIGLDIDLGYYQISESSIRKDDKEDPRIFAIADYLVWSNQHKDSATKNFRNKRKLAAKVLRKQYAR